MIDTDCGHSPRIEGDCHECCKRSLEMLRGKYHALREAAWKALDLLDSQQASGTAEWEAKAATVTADLRALFKEKP